MTNESNPNQKPAAHSPQDHQTAPEQERISPGVAVTGVVIVVLVFAALAIFGILNRKNHDRVLAKTTTTAAAPTVIALPAKAGATIDSFVLPGNVTAYTDSPIYARTSGYLLHWYFDIGSHVKQGALLAEIATPEVDQQLAQAEADLGTAQANATNAKAQAQRYQGLVDSNAVSRQDTETFTNQAAATASGVRSAQANMQRLKELQSFEKVYAPFDGVVTARSIDTGQLIDPGAGKELFHMQALQTLRIYTNVPQEYSSHVKHGAKIDITLPEHPNKIFQGTIVRTADSIDPASRTLLVEIDVNNREGELLPGSLAQVHFKAPQIGSTFVIPAAALIFRTQGTQVATVTSDNKAHLVPVIIGEDDGATVQIISGLQGSDRVIQDPPDSIIEGEKVSPQTQENQGQGNQPAAGGKQ
jgi:RND family efflux transporter MFP subunit